MVRESRGRLIRSESFNKERECGVSPSPKVYQIVGLEEKIQAPRSYESGDVAGVSFRFSTSGKNEVLTALVSSGVCAISGRPRSEPRRRGSTRECSSNGRRGGEVTSRTVVGSDTLVPTSATGLAIGTITHISVQRGWVNGHRTGNLVQTVV